MGQVFSYIWRRIRRPNNVVETETTQNDPFTPLDDQSHYITILDGVATQPDVITENDRVNHQEEEEDEEAIQEVIQFTPLENDNVEQDEEEEVVVEKVIQEVVKKEVTTSQVLATPVKEYGVLGETIIRRIGPYTSMHRILLVGEGDFSFSTSLAVAFGSASNMIATSLNTEEYLTKNYRKFPTHKRELEIRGCMLIHGVDATIMMQHLFRKNQNLIRGFVRNAKKMIDEDGEIHITHKTSRFFRQWDIPKIGCDEGLHLIQEIKFKRHIYPGYYTMFGFGGDRYFHCNPSKTYKFGLRPKSI